MGCRNSKPRFVVSALSLTLPTDDTAHPANIMHRSGPLMEMHADAALFNLEYERWLGEHSKVVARLRAAAEEHRPDVELRAYVDEAAAHYGALMDHKARLAAADPLHLLSGLWKGAAERCFLWIGGFRASELVKVNLLLLICR